MNRCVKCIMDQSDPYILFDENGVCNHCHNFDLLKKRIEQERKNNSFEVIVNKIKLKNKKKKYDCILGLSGGVDSSYLLHLAVKNGLRVLVVHVDGGWNSETAVSNIHKLCSNLNVELHTIVIDWPTMREIQRAYMFSGLPNLDVPQDHAFLVGTLKFAKKYKINYMLNGSNIATEGILPSKWGYNALDYRNIKDVYKNFGRNKKIKRYPHLSFLSMAYLLNSKRINLLNYVDYSKSSAIEVLSSEYGWIYYGGKHYESRFTKFFQQYYLPTKFNYDKRIAHLSSLIVGGELSRELALENYYRMLKVDMPLDEEIEYVLKKLDISSEEFEDIKKLPLKSHHDYKNNEKLFEFLFSIKRIINEIRSLK